MIYIDSLGLLAMQVLSGYNKIIKSFKSQKNRGDRDDFTRGRKKNF